MNSNFSTYVLSNLQMDGNTPTSIPRGSRGQPTLCCLDGILSRKADSGVRPEPPVCPWRGRETPDAPAAVHPAPPRNILPP